MQFLNLEQEDYEAVQIRLSMRGKNFEFTATLNYYNQVA